MADSQWVIFVIANEFFACPVAAVQEVIPYTEPVPVPGGPSEISGVLNVRGDIIPVVRTANLLNTRAEQARRIIILDKGEGLTGMEVDRVEEIIDVHPDEVDYSMQDNEHIRGTILHRERLVVLMEPQLAA